MNDTEIFELCKEVYKRTGWIVEGLPYGAWFVSNPDGAIYLNGTVATRKGLGNICPLYTTDYLLEKLPDALGSPSFNVLYRLQLKKINDWYSCEYSNHGWFQSMKSVFTRKGYDTDDDSLAYGLKPVSGDTPLKALLKLVIALDDAGELKS